MPVRGKNNPSVLNPIPRSTFSFNQDSTSGNSANYGPIGADGAVGTTEANAQLSIFFPFKVTRVVIRVQANSKDSSTTFAFRDDNVSIGAQTVSAAATGEFDSGALNVLVASGSKCNFVHDTSSSTSGSIQYTIMAQYEVMG